jgi:hypothetical protein
MGIHRMGPPADLICALQAQTGLQDFIETGTYRGDTAAWAAEHFARVTTIELSPEFHAAAVTRFQSQPKVRALQGYSAAVLREVVPALSGPALFWLDAHWSGLDTAGRDSECPLLEEIELINAADSAAPHCILVDDARLFCAPPHRPHRAEQWPDLAATVNALRDGGRRYVALWQDVFVAVPEVARSFVIGWLQDEATAQREAEPNKSWWGKIRG